MRATKSPPRQWFLRAIGEDKMFQHLHACHREFSQFHQIYYWSHSVKLVLNMVKITTLFIQANGQAFGNDHFLPDFSECYNIEHTSSLAAHSWACKQESPCCTWVWWCDQRLKPWAVWCVQERRKATAFTRTHTHSLHPTPPHPIAPHHTHSTPPHPHRTHSCTHARTHARRHAQRRLLWKPTPFYFDTHSLLK